MSQECEGRNGSLIKKANIDKRMVSKSKELRDVIRKARFD